MEAVPRLPMLFFELRTSPEKVDFSTKLKQYIRNYYNEDPTMYAAGFTGIDTLRREAVAPSKSIVGCSIMKRYFCQLHFMASRFPMRENGEAAIPFSWKSLHSNTTVTSNDVSLEMASILYNIGALHTQLGAMDNRTSTEGMKMSCTHFQCAAWAFQHINEEYPFPKSFGLSPVLMSFMCHLSLAQAQECILEKSMMDNRKSAITAKVGIQVVDYYKQSLSLLLEWPQSEENSSDISGLKVYKSWHKYVLFKIAYYETISLLFLGQQSEDQQKMGERVTYYQAAFEKLEEARKLPPGLENTDNVMDALTFVHDVIEGKRKAAKNENEFIYHEDVPNLAHLPKIKGASLVKGISFNINDIEVCGPDLFSSIVPMQAHESASLYSEEKAKLLRKINGMIANKDEELETFLSMLDLEEIKSKMDGNKLPQDLIDRCASLNAKSDAVQNLTRAMSKLSDIYQDVGEMLSEIKEMLKQEENHESEYQQMLGKRPPSIVATDLTREAKKYNEAHAKASESNQTLHKAMLMHISNLELLSLPLKELVNHIPTVVESPEVQAVTNEMQHLMSKVEEMKKQRLMLTGQLRDLVCQDDITRQVIIYSGERIEDLFEQELKKYDKYVSLIEQNLAAQENILRALKDTYARYGSTRKSTGELQRKRTAVITSLVASYDAYEDLMTKSNKGLEFYKKLETNVSKLLQRVRGTCKVQDEEREQMLKSVKNSETTKPHAEVPPATTTLKLKDYLNIKKETGKLALIEPSTIPPVTHYYNDLNLSQTNWMPGTRPAPVGSEETDTSLNTNPSDSFRGFYQSEGKDQIWSNSNYTAPQNTDQKLKYFLPQNSTTPSGYSHSAPYGPCNDAYPISSYSTVLPKTEGQVNYEPKSNYYDIQDSPNRCYNPVQPYAESIGSSSTVFGATGAIGFSQASNSNNVAADVSACYVYPNNIPVAYPTPPHSYNVTPQPDVAIGTYGAGNQSLENQPLMSPHYSQATYPQSNPSYGLNETSQASPGYGSSVNDQSTALNGKAYSGGYQPPVATSHPGVSMTMLSPQDQAQVYQSTQSYQSQAFGTDSHINQTSQPPYSYAVSSTGLYPGYQSTDTNAVQYGAGSENSDGTWANTYASSQQYLQSGNESLYTASHTPNQYAMTNSDVYKTPEVQDVNYSNQYTNQYYNNQYGAYNGQAEVSAQNGNPLTYMQAGMDRQQAVTTTTFSYPEAKSSPVTNPSNVDLLAGLDFNIGQSPLVPETADSVEEKKKDPNTKTTEPRPASKVAPEPCMKLNLSSDSVQERPPPPKDWTVIPECVANFAQEVEKYEKFVEGLTLKTLGGPTSLDIKWKEIVDVQEKTNPQHIISVARCYPMKNRFPDILPYDDSRVELPSTKDDYINASKMRALTDATPTFILTQAPLPATYADFWAMVFEQQVEVVVCLLNDSELDGHVYWPQEKGQEVEMGKLKISLQSCNVRSYWVERILFLCGLDSKATRVVVHLQFTAWPGSSFPESPEPFLTFSSECKNFFTQQRSYSHPVVVHCLSGVGRSGLFCLIIASILDIQAGKGIPEIAGLAGRMCEFRKSCLRDREHLKFAYHAILHYSRDFLIKRGILTNRSVIEDKKSNESKSHTRNSTDASLTSATAIQAGIERLQIDSETAKEESNGKALDKSGVGQSTSVSCESSMQNSDALANLDSVTFSLRMDSTQKKKKFSPESFNKGSTMEVNPTDDDPLSQLDPLWTMKK